MMKKAMSVFIVITCCIGIIGCAESEKHFDYPDKFTTNYCYNNYSPMELNYIYAHTYKNAVPGDHYDGKGTWRWFYAIPNVSEDEFIACRERFGLIGYSLDAIVYRANDSETIPLNDWTVDYIELCRYNYDKMSDNDDNIRKYGDIIYHSNIKTISDAKLSEQILQCINNKSMYLKDGSDTELVIFDNGKEKYWYAIRIHFKETAMIMWHSVLTHYNGRYYLSYYSDDIDSEQLILLTGQLNEFISSNIDTAN